MLLPLLLSLLSISTFSLHTPVCASQFSASDTSAPVEVGIRTSWRAPSLLLEIIETVAIESPNNFHLALDVITSPEFSPKTLKLDVEIYNDAFTQLTLAGVFSEPGSRESVDALLSLHAASPHLEALREYYNDVVAPSVNPPQHCGSWVMLREHVTCDTKELKSLVSQLAAIPPEDDEEPSLPSRVYPFDHVYPYSKSGVATTKRIAILYISYEKEDYRELYNVLSQAADSAMSTLSFVVRYVPTAVPNAGRSYLSGYGVALDLKKTDYLALDDRRTSSSSKETSDTPSEDTVFENLDSDDDIIPQYLSQLPDITNMTDYMTPLVEDEYLSLTSKAAWVVSTSERPLDALRQLSQNFPKYAAALAKRVPLPPEDFIKEMTDSRMQVPSGYSGFWLNGQNIPDTELSPLTLIRTLRAERKRILTLGTLGLTPSQAVTLISTPSTDAAAPRTQFDGYFDASDRVEGGGVIVWWNDIEKDTRYAQWPSKLGNLLHGSFYGQPANVKRNLHNIIVVLDLSQPSSLEFLTGAVPTIIGRNIPLRWGTVPLLESETSRKVARLLFYLVERFGRSTTIKFLRELADPTRVAVDLIKARSLYHDVERKHTEEHPDEIILSFDVVINSAFEESLEKARAYALRLGTSTALSKGGHAFVNGKHFEFTEDFLKHLQTEMSVQTNFLVEQLYKGNLQDPDDTLDISVYFYDLPGTPKRRNSYIYPPTQLRPGTVGVRLANLPDAFENAGITRSALDYVYPAGVDPIPLTIWVVGNLNQQGTLDLLREAAIAMAVVNSYRLGFIHVPDSKETSVDKELTSISESLITLYSRHALAGASVDDFLSVLNRLSPSPQERPTDPRAQAVLEEESPLHALLAASTVKANRPSYDSYIRSTKAFSQQMRLDENEPSLIVNGRIIGPISQEGIIAADFEALAAYELDRRVNPVSTALNSTLGDFEGLDRIASCELLTMASSVVSSASFTDPSEIGIFRAPPEPRNKLYESLISNNSALYVGDRDKAMFQIGVVLNPLSEVAQKWSSILTWLSQIAPVHITIVMTPHPTEGLPLKRFYRYNLPNTLRFNDLGAQADLSVSFYNLPPEPIYTLSMEVAQSWLVRPRECSYDLDNIHLSGIPVGERKKGVTAVFDLDFLVIEGHARESALVPPRGVQLELTKINSTIPIADTLVMANVGYLQFRAKPGVFQLGIRSGRSREVYDMESVGNEGWNSPSIQDAGDVVTLTSFEGLTLYPRLKRKAGQEKADVLEESTTILGDSFIAPAVSWMKSYFSSGGDKEISANVQAEINIFTVASGLLYERFVGIMILSVLQNTNSSVKFWFIENFLSPSFLEFIPHLAESYGFQYELVTYKWPSWLRAQTEKQRIIWAYKILFLDVLFPMDLKRVVFVDADQIVRADLKELVDLDLHGAPYGYTPMGDDNVDMEGFRFWKTGYWKDFLRGKPYHISALYVIDLVRFRQIAAGDRLRGSYHGLSADPNSLANLDQDLPNNLQHEVPIFSLPEDWLWCETWCSKDRLDRAKTIDLCQNPLTKEPKLSRARQIPEWEQYDAEIARFAQKLVSEGKIKSGAAASNVNELASIGSKNKAESEALPDSEQTSNKGSKHDAGEL